MVIYLCATRRGRAEGRSGGAEVLRRRRGGSELGEAALRGERRLGVPLVVWAPRVGSRRLLGSRRDSYGGRWRLGGRGMTGPRRRRGVCVAERAGGGAGVW